MYGAQKIWFEIYLVQILLCIIRPVAGQGSSPDKRFSFLKHFRILYPFIPNTIQISQRFCDNWHCEDLTQKNSKSLTLILRSRTGIGMVLHKILDKALIVMPQLNTIHQRLCKTKAENVKWMVPYKILDQFLSPCQTWIKGFTKTDIVKT